MFNELTGKTFDGLNRALSLRQINVRYDFRIVDELGAVFSLSNGAVMNRSRSFALDNGSWQLTLSILKARVPSGLTIQQYHEIQVDRGVGDGLWAYFRGRILEVSERIERRGGSIVEVIEARCQGTLERLSGVFVPRVRYQVKPRIWPAPLLGVARTITYQDTVVRLANDHVALSGNSHVYLRETAGSANRDTSIGTTVVVGKDANFSSLWVQGTDYYVKTNLVPYQIEWRVNTGATPIFIRYRVLDRWVSPKWIGQNIYTDPYVPITRTINAASAVYGLYEGSGAVTSGIYVLSENSLRSVPSGSRTWTVIGTVDWVGLFPQTPLREPNFLCDRRDPANLMQTSIANISGLTITPTDAASYAQGISNLSSTEPGLPASGWVNREYLTVTWPDGEEGTSEITGINRTTGVLTFATLPVHPVSGAAAVVGYAMRVSTCEGYGAWDDSVQCDLSRNASGLSGLTSANILKPECYQVNAWAGMAFPIRGYSNTSSNLYWLSTDYIWAAMGTPDASGLYSGGALVVERRRKDIIDTSGTGKFINKFETAIQNIVGDTYIGADAIKPYSFTNLNASNRDAGITVRNFYKGQNTLDQIVSELIKNNAPPNLLMSDRPDGNLALKTYSQSSSPDYSLPGIASVDISTDAEKITSVVVVSNGQDQQSVNVAAKWFGGVSKLTASSSVLDVSNSTFITDGIGDDGAKFAENVHTASAVWFNIPPMSPGEIYPVIDKIVIKGAGSVRLLAKPGKTFEFITSTTISGGAATSLVGSIAVGPHPRYTLTKDGVELDQQSCMSLARPDIWTTFVIYFDGNQGTVDGVTKSGLFEVEIWTKQVSAFAARMTDNTNLASNVTVNSAGFGTTWIQPDSRKNVSFRFAPTSWMKRNASTYGGRITEYFVTNNGSGYTTVPTVTVSGTGTGASAQAYVETGIVTQIVTDPGSAALSNQFNVDKQRGNGYTDYPTVTLSGAGGATVVADIVQHRTRILNMNGLSQNDCRVYAQNYMDEYLRSHLVYTVQAPLLDYAEPGDTVLVQLPDGSQKTLLLWGISDGGGAADNMATYTLRDYSL